MQAISKYGGSAACERGLQDFTQSSGCGAKFLNKITFLQLTNY